MNLTIAAFLLAAAVSLAWGTVGPGGDRREFGHSVLGRELTAMRLGGPAPDHRVLVVGSIHGDETAGHEIVARLRRGSPELPVALWTMRSLNPDGVRTDTRVNARGVDLNRNFPVGWQAGEPPGSGYYPGSEPASEPETRAAIRLIRHLRPTVTIWYHQPWDQVLAPCRGSAAPERLYARVARVPLERCRGQRLPGTATRWQERRVGGTAFVVELGAGELTGREARRHARAVRLVARGFG